MNPYEHAVAHAEQALADAQQRYEEASQEVAKIQTRIDAIKQRRESIKSDLASGNLDDKSAGGLLHAAGEDLSDLTRLLAQAQGARNAINPIREREKLAAAKADLERSRRETEFDALSQHAKQIENTLLQTIAELYQMGRELGRPSPLSASWRPSQSLEQAIRLNVPPAAQR